MTWDEVRNLPKEGMQLGCHTLTHPYLTRIRSDETLQREIAGAKRTIEARTGVPVTSLAYPFGQYNSRVVAAAKAAGFTSARSTWPGVIHSKEGLFSLTGLIRTESEKSLVDSMQKYLNQSPLVEGVAVPVTQPRLSMSLLPLCLLPWARSSTRMPRCRR